MKKIINDFKSFCKERSLCILIFFLSIIFFVLDVLFENCGFYLLFIMSAYSYFYCCGRYDEKENNKKCQL